MPVPPAAVVTMQTVEELMKQYVQREVFRFRKSLDELAQEQKKALEDNLSLMGTAGEMGRQLIKHCEEEFFATDSSDYGSEGKCQGQRQ